MESVSADSSDNVSINPKEDVKSQPDHVMNGLSNGINKSTDGHQKHKHKDKDKHHDRHKHKDKDRDKERHLSSKDKSKEESSEKKHKDERKDKEHRDKDRDHKDKYKDKERSKDKESRDKVKEHSDKNKENRDKDHKDRSKGHGDRDKHRDHKSSSSSSKHETDSGSSKSHSTSKDREKHHSSKDKHSSDKHKDRHSGSSDKHSSSSKHASSSDKKSSHEKPDKSEKLKDRSSDAEKEKKHRDKEQVKIKSERVNEKLENKEKSENVKIKLEPLADEENEESISKSSANNSEPSQESSQLFIKIEPDSVKSVKSEPESEEDIPLSKCQSSSTKRKSVSDEDDEDDVPLSARKKVKKEGAPKKRKNVVYSEDEYDSEIERKKKKNKDKIKKELKSEPKETASPTKKKRKDEEEQEVWKWWEEEKKDDGVKWKFLEHKGPMFAPPYEPLPKNVKFYYDGKEMRLSQDAEEIATFYSRLIEHDYTTKEVFNKNFFKDWRKSMTKEEKEVITDLKKCNFRPMYEYFVQKSEERKAMSKEEKKKIKEQNDEIAKEYGICTIDGHKEKIGNFKVEPPGLFRGRGEHPKMGMLKRRIMPEDVIINCSRDSNKPVPPEGHKWKEVKHDNTVTWLASWTENVQGNVKYVMLNPSSKLKGEKDWQKYETARKLAKCVDKIREDYREDWKSKEMRIRQRAVAMYFIDKLALRAGNEKDEDQADTVGCCSLRFEHIQLHEEKDGKEYVVVFDFPGKDSIRYYNEVPVEKRVFKNLQLFCEKKKNGDDLFDRINTAVLNKHLNELMEGLTAKVFRTYNASITLQNQLNELTDPKASVPEKILQYNRANRAVAVLCNHQRSVPKSHEKSMGNLKQKIDAKKEQIAEAQKQYKEAKRNAKDDGTAHSKMALDKKKKALDRLKDQLMKLEVQETDKEENKTIALGTSKLNYLDPRISVAWCRKYDVPIEKVYNKTQRSKFRWAIDMAGPEFVF